jgi:hypothetical protein
MRGADLKKGFLRGMSKAASFVMKCIMLILGAILKSAGRAWSWADYHQQQQQQPGDDDVAFLRDLESGDPDRERERDRPGREGGGERDRGMSPLPDEDDVYDNPWWKNSLDSPVGARSVHAPSLDGDGPRGLDALDDDELTHPDAFDIDPEDGENPFVEPTPELTPVPNPYVDLVPLRPISTLELDVYEADDEHEDETGDNGVTPIAAGDFAAAAAPDSDSDSAASLTAAPSPAVAPEKVSPAPSVSDVPLPGWLISHKATAGPRASRFIEDDVDGLTIAPPDLDFVAGQHELLERAPFRMARGSTWSSGQDGGETRGPSRRKAARNSI